MPACLPSRYVKVASLRATTTGFSIRTGKDTGPNRSGPREMVGTWCGSHTWEVQMLASVGRALAELDGATGKASDSLSLPAPSFSSSHRGKMKDLAQGGGGVICKPPLPAAPHPYLSPGQDTVQGPSFPQHWCSGYHLAPPQTPPRTSAKCSWSSPCCPAGGLSMA